MKKYLVLTILMLLIGACGSPQPEIVIETVVVEITSTTEPTATVEPTATAEPDIAETGAFGLPVKDVADYLADKLDIHWSFKTTPSGTFAKYIYDSNVVFYLITSDGNKQGPLEDVMVLWISTKMNDLGRENISTKEAREIVVWFYDAVGIGGVRGFWDGCTKAAGWRIEDCSLHWQDAGLSYAGIIDVNPWEGSTAISVKLK